MKRLSLYIALLLTSLSFAGCVHKDLELQNVPTTNIPIVFDWRNAPDADPSSMAVVFFDEEEEIIPLRYTFAGKHGGRVKIPYGKFCAIGFNSDNTDWARFRGTESIDSYELYTHDVRVLPSFGLDPSRVPRARSTDMERMAEAPGMFWNHRLDKIRILTAADTSAIVFYPEEGVCHYTVTVIDVENLKYVLGAELDATVSGLAEGFYHGSHAPTSTPVTMPLVLRASEDNKSLYGEFLNFGICPDRNNKHILTIYMVFDDGSAAYYTFDVTDQVEKAPDPRHVDILVKGLTLPKPIDNGGGLHPNVDEWENVNIDINL